MDSVQATPRVVPQERIWCIFEAEEYREVVKVTSPLLSPLPPKLGSERIVEKIDDLTVPRFVAVPQECGAERTVEQTEDVPMQQITLPVPFQKETDEVILSFPAERQSERTIAQIVDTSALQLQEQIVEVAEIIPQERTSEHTVEPTVGVPVPQIQEQIVEVAEIIPQERT